MTAPDRIEPGYWDDQNPQTLRLSCRAATAMLVHAADDVRVRDAVGQDLLAVADGVAVSEAGEDDSPRDVEQELVPGRHRLQYGGQLQVLDQVRAMGRKVGGEVEIVLLIKQVGLHELSRPLSCS